MLDLKALGEQIADLIAEATAPLLAQISGLQDQVKELKSRHPERGEKGEPGPAGQPGRDAEPVLVADVVRELVSCTELRPVLDLLATEAVAKYFEANPPKDGKDGPPGPAGTPGAKGADGKDGLGVADLLIDRDGVLVATFEDGRMKHLGPVVGKDGSPGRDGADFSGVEFDYDGERALTIRGKGGDIVKRLPIPVDRGYYREGMACEKGDIVTHGGSAFLALRDTKAKPCTENSEDWRLFARKGRDGKDGRDGRDLVSGVNLDA